MGEYVSTQSLVFHQWARALVSFPRDVHVLAFRYFEGHNCLCISTA